MPTMAVTTAEVAASPTAEALIYGILQLQKKIRRENTLAR